MENKTTKIIGYFEHIDEKEETIACVCKFDNDDRKLLIELKFSEIPNKEDIQEGQMFLLDEEGIHITKTEWTSEEIKEIKEIKKKGKERYERLNGINMNDDE